MKTRVAIVGFGFMGQMHAKAYQSIPDVEIVGIVDTFPGAKDVSEKMGLKLPVDDSIPALLKRQPVDILNICLPTDLHAEAVITAARSVKHVFCEKPLALEIADGERILAEIEKNGVTFQVGQCIRFWPEYQALAQFIQSGRGGKLCSLSLQRRSSRPTHSINNWLNKPERSKSAAFDLHIHDTDYILSLFGKPRAVRSVGHPDGKSFSRIFTQYDYEGVAVVAEGGWDLPPKWGFQMAVQAVFENAVVELDSSSSPTLHVTIGNETRVPLPFEKPKVASGGVTTGNISDLGGYYNELAYFCDCVRNGKKPEIATGRQALESVRTVLAEIQSAEEKKIITLPA